MTRKELTHCQVVFRFEGAEFQGLGLGVVEVRLVVWLREFGGFDEAFLKAGFLCCFLKSRQSLKHRSITIIRSTPSLTGPAVLRRRQIPPASQC